MGRVTLPLAERRRYLKAARDLAATARRVIRRRLVQGVTKRVKADASYVTDADLAVERALRAAIRRRFPAHGIIGEEFPSVRPEAPFQWILDPIDGTLSFTHGIPFFGTIIGLHHRGRPIAGVIDHLGLDRCYSAGLGLGAFLNGQRLRIRDLKRGEPRAKEVVATGDRYRFVACGRGGAYDRLAREHQFVRAYADCLGHTLAAEGSVGAMVDFGVSLWDISVTQLLIEEAGGRYQCVFRKQMEGRTQYGIVCGKPSLVRWLAPKFGAAAGR